MSQPQHCLPMGSSHGTGWALPGPRAPPLLHPLFSHATQFSRGLSAAQASGFQRQCFYLKPLLFTSLTRAATSCCRSMRAHPGLASQRKAANEEQVQRRLFFVLITKPLPKQSPSAWHPAAIYSSHSPGHAGSFLQTAMPWDPFDGPQGRRLSGPMALGAAHKDALSLRASLAEAAARAGGSVRARERVGSPWGQLSTRPWQPWGSFSIWVASLLPSSSSLQAGAHLPLLLLCWPWVQGCAAAGRSKGLGAPAKPLCARAACLLPLIPAGICCTPMPGTALTGN